MYTKIYDKLPQEAINIRNEVFVKEQGFHEEFDEKDNHSKHLVLFDKQKAIATCRFYEREASKDYIIGRIAVVKQYRGRNIGSYILGEAEAEIKELGGERIFLHAQERVKGFYEKQGYCSCGEMDLDESCPHIWMYKKCGKNQETHNF